MMSTTIVAPPIEGRACIGKAASLPATRTGPVRRSSIESAMAAISSKKAPMPSWPSRRGEPTGSSIQASGANALTYPCRSPEENAAQ